MVTSWRDEDLLQLGNGLVHRPVVRDSGVKVGVEGAIAPVRLTTRKSRSG